MVGIAGARNKDEADCHESVREVPGQRFHLSLSQVFVGDTRRQLGLAKSTRGLPFIVWTHAAPARPLAFGTKSEPGQRMYSTQGKSNKVIFFCKLSRADCCIVWVCEGYSRSSCYNYYAECIPATYCMLHYD